MVSRSYASLPEGISIYQALFSAKWWFPRIGVPPNHPLSWEETSKSSPQKHRDGVTVTPLRDSPAGRAFLRWGADAPEHLVASARSRGVWQGERRGYQQRFHGDFMGIFMLIWLVIWMGILVGSKHQWNFHGLNLAMVILWWPSQSSMVEMRNGARLPSVGI